MQTISKQENNNLPILNGITDFLNEFVPYELLQNDLVENKTIDIKNLIGQFKRLFYEMFYKEDAFIYSLIDERDHYSICNTPPGNQNLFIEHYNKKVIKTITDFCNYIIKNFRLHPDFEANKDLLNIGAFFMKWYNEFDEISLSDLENKNSNINRNDIKISLKTLYDEEQLKKLHKALIEGNYIENKTKENDFIYLLSGKPLNGIKKIKWKESKKKAIYLLHKICVDYSLYTINNCIESNFTRFDSNDKSKTGYTEIDDILKTLRPINTTTL